MGDICTIKIGPGSLITEKYTVGKDCNLRWKFKSEGGDLGFGVQRKISEKTSDRVSIEEDPSGDIKDVLSITRVSKIFIINYFLKNSALRSQATQMCRLVSYHARLVILTSSPLTTPTAGSRPRLSSTRLSWTLIFT